MVDEWHTLINPGRTVDPYVQRLTGIHPGMVLDAPTFEHVAEEVHRRIEGRVFVAHNVGFDWAHVSGELVEAEGYRVLNVDATIILERPKLRDYRQAIREKLAGTLKLDAARISVKFKTAEKLGPVGEGRSAEAQAVVTLARES